VNGKGRRTTAYRSKLTVRLFVGGARPSAQGAFDGTQAKVIAVRLALVGAPGSDNEVSCDVRHGANYEQRRADGKINSQQLKSLVNNRIARLQALGGDGGLATDPAPPAVGSLAFWGRGIGGDWEVTLPGSRHNADLDLSGLTEVQVWIGYRFLR